MKTAFIRPRFVGERFDEHSIPLEVLKDWAGIETLVVETAKWLYRQEHQGRVRVPRGFADGFALHLSAIGEGSAVAVLDRTSGGDLFPDVYAEWFDKARDRIFEVIRAAANGLTTDGLLPNQLLSLFDKFGRSLRESEQVEFSLGDGGVVKYDARIRKTLVLKTASEYRTEEQLRGEISLVDAERLTLTLKLLNGRKISGPFPRELREQAVDALSNFGESPVLVDCVVVRDHSDNLKQLESISRIEPLDPLDVPARLESLAQLADGWLDRAGLALSPGGGTWLSHAWLNHFPKNAPLPYLYATPEGGVQAEWDLDSVSIQLEIDLAKKSGVLLMSSKGTGELQSERVLNLDSIDGWRALTAALGQSGQ
ncbi:MAG: hypothetical protein RIR70_2073 [Pseudomonadota bacterium]